MSDVLYPSNIYYDDYDDDDKIYFISKRQAVYGYDLDDRKLVFINSGYEYATSLFKYEENLFVSDVKNGIYHLRISEDYYYQEHLSLNVSGIRALGFYISDFTFISYLNVWTVAAIGFVV